MSKKPHQIRHLLGILSREFPYIAPENILGAIKSAAKESRSSDKLLEKARAGLESMEVKR